MLMQVGNMPTTPSSGYAITPSGASPKSRFPVGRNWPLLATHSYRMRPSMLMLRPRRSIETQAGQKSAISVLAPKE